MTADGISLCFLATAKVEKGINDTRNPLLRKFASDFPNEEVNI